jgi:hypothetical protein
MLLSARPNIYIIYFEDGLTSGYTIWTHLQSVVADITFQIIGHGRCPDKSAGTLVTERQKLGNGERLCEARGCAPMTGEGTGVRCKWRFFKTFLDLTLNKPNVPWLAISPSLDL